MTRSPQPSLRVGVDVGGTFTKAVAVVPRTGELRASAEVPTSHGAADGVSEGVAGALAELLGELGSERDLIEYVTFSTTQAMNALLEGDVSRVGVVGIGAPPDLRRARRRTRVGRIALAPGRELHTEHVFLDATGGITVPEADEALERLAKLGCESIAASGAFAVDAPDHELLIADRARALGMPSCCGHELTGAYGLETRTVSAAINSAILPVVERTAGVVERALVEAGIDVPLLVLRGDGGSMNAGSFHRRPSFTVGSGPAAGVAAALQALGVSDALVLECGGTSSNVSVIKGGRPALRSIRVMGRPTAIRSVDSWVVGAAGGSMARLGRRSVAETGPRSAHIAGLPYACFSSAEELRGCELELLAPRAGDPEAYAVVRARDRRFALTVSCAANALGLPEAGEHAAGDREAALAAFSALGVRLRRDPEQAASAVLEGAVSKVADAAADAARRHRLGPEVPLVVLGGAASALARPVSERLSRPLLRPSHPEVLSAIGAATSLVRTEVCRAPRGAEGDAGEARRLEIAHEAERACVGAGASPASVSVETAYEPDQGVIRAVATGAVALETQSARRRPVSAERQLGVAAETLSLSKESLELVAASDFYRVYSENGSGRVAVVDALGGVARSEVRARGVLAGEGGEFLERLRRTVDDASISLGIAVTVPRVTVVCGAKLLDLSDARDADEIVAAAERAMREHRGEAVALVAR
ncbi:MAG: hydantoinase/oxoprolinase family protein [Solirubrobacterales bacterium]